MKYSTLSCQVSWNDRPTPDIYYHWHLPNLYINHSDTATKYPPQAFAHLASAPRARCQPPDLSEAHFVWWMFWFQHDLGRRRKEQTQEFFYHLLFNTIQLYQLFLLGSCYRFPTEIMTLTWPTQTLAFQTELLQDRMSASIKGSSGKNWFPKMLWKQKWWWANQGKIFWLKLSICMYI